MKLLSSFPKDRPASFPVKAGKNNAIVRIYVTSERGYETFKLPYFDNGIRKFHRYPTYSEAATKGNEMIEQYNKGHSDAVVLTSEDKVIYQQALNILAPFGIKLNTAVERFAEATRILGNVSLIEAAQFYRKRHPIDLPNKNVSDAIDDYILAKTAAKRSDRHVDDLTSRLGRVKKAFTTNPLNSITESDIAMFLDGLRQKNGEKMSPRSQNNFRSTIVSFFRWAKKKKYLPTDWDEVSSIEVVEDGEGDIKIFNVDDMVAIFRHAPPELIPFLSVGAFAGLRSSEICRLDWKEIGIGENGNYIEVKAATAKKTGKRRLIPIQTNLRTWLKPFRKKQGKIWPFSPYYVYRLLDDVETKAKVKWEDNVLRHSYISYRVADIKNVPEVALESGNSPQMIFQHYREIVTQEQAKRWFSICRDDDGKVIFATPEQLKAAA
jgi:integrase